MASTQPPICGSSSMKSKQIRYISKVKKIKTKYTPDPKRGIGDPDEMVCANLKELISARDTWLDEWGEKE